MCDNLIACLNANQIHTIQPDKFPNNHILLYCCNPNLHPSFEFLALERKHIDRKQLLTTVNRALIKGLNHIGFFFVFPAFLAALKNAVNPRLQVEAPMSPTQMEYFWHKKPEKTLETIAGLIAQCREKCGEVEFIADDELVEVTPKNIRLRKKILDHAERMRITMRNRAAAK